MPSGPGSMVGATAAGRSRPALLNWIVGDSSNRPRFRRRRRRLTFTAGRGSSASFLRAAGRPGRAGGGRRRARRVRPAVFVSIVVVELGGQVRRYGLRRRWRRVSRTDRGSSASAVDKPPVSGSCPEQVAAAPAVPFLLGGARLGHDFVVRFATRPRRPQNIVHQLASLARPSRPSCSPGEDVRRLAFATHFVGGEEED